MLESSSNDSEGSDEMALLSKRQSQMAGNKKQNGKRKLIDSEEEVRKWINARLQNFPCKENQWKKAKEKREREQTGEVNTEEELSILERKMRKKIAILNGPEDRAAKQKERNKKFLLHDLTHGSKMAPMRPTFHKLSSQENKENPWRRNKTKQEHQRDMEHGGQEPENYENEGGIEPEMENHQVKERGEDNEAERIQEDSQQRRKRPEPSQRGRNQRGRNQMESEKGGAETKKKESSYEEMLESIRQKTEVDQKEFEEFSETGKGPRNTSGHFWYMQNTLMENILLDEILRERSILLQAIRYIVSNNYLQPSK